MCLSSAEFVLASCLLKLGHLKTMKVLNCTNKFIAWKWFFGTTFKRNILFVSVWTQHTYNKMGFCGFFFARKFSYRILNNREKKKNRISSFREFRFKFYYEFYSISWCRQFKVFSVLLKRYHNKWRFFFPALKNFLIKKIKIHWLIFFFASDSTRWLSGSGKCFH